MEEKKATPFPNRLEINAKLTTSGQPTADGLATLGAQGFDAVIYLAPPTVSDAVPDEAVIVARQGLTFVNIPIKFSTPTDKDFESFVGVLSSLEDRKVMVHCQVNFRASSMVFLYRTIIKKEDPALAYEAVAKIWSPDKQWKAFIQTALKKHNIEFEPY
jgi:protein tyrosine phosphatase (PTP) superfamily phosphohydrolase (DUF442 family)